MDCVFRVCVYNRKGNIPRKGGTRVRYIVFDVETPNARCDRISAIGIAVVEDGVLERSYAFLVNPETCFERFNIALTGITPEMVRDAPSFPALWRRIHRLMESGVLAAHNAPFDMRVLARCVKAYGLPAPPIMRYACTCRMARAFLPEMENHRLDTLCARLRIPLQHHRAESDALACAGILTRFMAEGRDVERYIRKYDMRAMRTLPARSNTR